MVELFRYIEQAFVIPAASSTIDVSTQSDFQNALKKDITDKTGADLVRKQVNDFITGHFTATDLSAVKGGTHYLSFRQKIAAAKGTTTKDQLSQMVKDEFGTDLSSLIGSDAWASDKILISDTAVATKLVTGFNLVDMASLVLMRQLIAFLEDVQSGEQTDLSVAAIQKSLSRPLKIPDAFLTLLQAGVSPAAPPVPNPVQNAPGSDATETALKAAYNQMMSIEPASLEIKTLNAGTYKEKISTTAAKTKMTTEKQAVAGQTLSIYNAPSSVVLSGASLQNLDQAVQETIKSQGIDLANTPIATAISSIKKKWLDLARVTRPANLPMPLKVYRLGVHLFALPQTTTTLDAPAPAPTPAPDFSTAITRPVGMGNLQVVRQELLGYVAGDISHIENVMEGELLKRNTFRKEVNELTTTDETESSQTEERDQQSTQRNELASETQKVASQQTSSSASSPQSQTSSTDYGKLVENSKSNYAQSITNKAVDTLSQMVKQQRIQREKKTFKEKTAHEFDNRQGTSKIRGIYQWVDKKYKTRIMNYGKRLLYDVVVPEPAAFLIESLKNATQAENFQLIKPVDPGIRPSDLDAGNYMWYATQYGVTGSVTPPPDDFLQTIVHADTQLSAYTADNVFGANVDGNYLTAFSIQIPDSYKAVSGFVQMSTQTIIVPFPDHWLEFFIGEHRYLRFGPTSINYLNNSFTMNGETGQMAVTLRTFSKVYQFNYAIGINCQRTDKLLEQWQLKTHAAITAGYQRQYADYLDKLSQYKTAVRTQLATAQNYEHDATVATQELKKAFIHLLMSEHFAQVNLPTPDPDLYPPDPNYIKKWGAVVAFFERAFEWENLMYNYYPYFWGRIPNWTELILIQDADPQFEAFLKAGACRVVIPARPGYEAALAHFQETGDIWMGEEMPDMFSDLYVSIIDEIKASNYAPGNEICVAEWDVTLPTTLIMLKDDAVLPEWAPTVDCGATAPE